MEPWMVLNLNRANLRREFLTESNSRREFLAEMNLASLALMAL